MRAVGFGFGFGLAWSAWSNATQFGDPVPGGVRTLVALLAVAYLMAWFGPRHRRGGASATAVASAESRSVATAGVVVNVMRDGVTGSVAGSEFSALDELPAPPSRVFIDAELVDDEQSLTDGDEVAGGAPQAQRAAHPLLWERR